jgi:hypothetical protein
MIALYVIAYAYAAAVVCVAGRLYVLGCARGLRRALSNTYRTPQGRPPAESAYSASHAMAQTLTPVVQWPRDN